VRLLLLVLLSSVPSFLQADDFIDTTYQLSPEKLDRLTQKLQQLVAAMHQDGDPQIEIQYSTDRTEQAHISWATQKLGEKPFKAIVQINRGLLEKMQSEDELAFVIAHEMSHTAAEYKRTGSERAIQSQREEIIVADLGAIERMIRAGYDPTAGREFFIKAIENNWQLHSLLERAVSTHPPHELRFTAIDVELKKRHDKAAFPPRVGDPDNWLKKYRESFIPPWSLSENAPKNMETLLRRLLNLTSLKNLPPHQQTAFITNVLFNKFSRIHDARNLIVAGLLYDPHVNPSPFIDELIYDFDKNDFSTVKQLPDHLWAYGNFVDVARDHKFSGKDVELLYAWLKETADNLPNFHVQSSITRSMHELAKGYQVSPAVF
jgi:hypothetical protein